MISNPHANCITTQQVLETVYDFKENDLVTVNKKSEAVYGKKKLLLVII
jgi:hypothetical protein